MTVSFIQSGNTKFFCKEECKEEDVLIETTKDTAQSGRYTIKYSETHRGEYLVSVTITNVTKSDSGGYRSGFKHRTYSLYHEFKINVEDGKFHEMFLHCSLTDAERFCPSYSLSLRN